MVITGINLHFLSLKVPVFLRAPETAILISGNSLPIGVESPTWCGFGDNLILITELMTQCVKFRIKTKFPPGAILDKIRCFPQEYLFQKMKKMEGNLNKKMFLPILQSP